MTERFQPYIDAPAPKRRRLSTKQLPTTRTVNTSHHHVQRRAAAAFRAAKKLATHPEIARHIPDTFQEFYAGGTLSLKDSKAEWSRMIQNLGSHEHHCRFEASIAELKGFGMVIDQHSTKEEMVAAIQHIQLTRENTRGSAYWGSGSVKVRIDMKDHADIIFHNRLDTNLLNMLFKYLAEKVIHFENLKPNDRMFIGFTSSPFEGNEKGHYFRSDDTTVDQLDFTSMLERITKILNSSNVLSLHSSSFAFNFTRHP